jgi:hypothetical protein
MLEYFFTHTCVNLTRCECEALKGSAFFLKKSFISKMDRWQIIKAMEHLYLSSLPFDEKATQLSEE